ncbi:MAG: hypothetical protein H7A23_26895 [Leptospiraceae bacterium]|nr:hypothetical protein [Nanoarchaeota archaeon]MCP5498199.1 hypothetical protein [Leptospiraceae bacterium]
MAEQSKNTANEIKELALNNLKATENSNTIIVEMIPELLKTAGLVQEISSASQEQKKGMEQISITMEQINQASQSNSAASEELAASSDGLKKQVSELKEFILNF